MVNSFKALLKSAELLPDKIGQYDKRLILQCIVIMLVEAGKTDVCRFFSRILTVAIDHSLVLAIFFELQRI